MIPRLDTVPQLNNTSDQYLTALGARGFQGEIERGFSARMVMATDNSIYQWLPQGIVYPRDTSDLVRLAELSQQAEYREVSLTPRGGGTGTNGQALNNGIIVDTSRHMNRILEINHNERWARVECGVVKDQLNAALKPFGLFFAPELSTSNRATIGGMVNTDASGQGSCLYGKTRDHVLELTTVLLDGSVLHSHALTPEELAAHREQQDRVGQIHRLVDGIYNEHKAAIAQKFPKLNRCLTGYDLAHIRDERGRFNLNNILCGSEGTLGFVTEVKLNLLPIPRHAALVIVRYSDFDSALRDAARLMEARPSSIETVDSKVLGLAMKDIVWHQVARYFPDSGPVATRGVNLVEYTAHSEEELKAGLGRLRAALRKGNPNCLGQTIASGMSEVNKVWGMRKKAVGLLGNAKGEARPVPFVEDTAVPPENLADFIQEFRQLLDSHKLDYGMFGHVDAGVLHVRPMLDMKDPQQARQVRNISDKVVALTHKYHGLLWGEHGKGVRSEYAPAFFGELYPQLQRIKAVFDPHNQLNPGKIATPAQGLELLKIDEVPTRGDVDRTIPVSSWQGYSEAVYCNGNGVCFNWDFNDAMCPSWKVTRDRVHSPKGRASLIREWLKQMNEAGADPVALLANPAGRLKFIMGWPQRVLNTRKLKRGTYDFSQEVQEAMAGCLSCKACAGQCPVKVDVPTFRSKFLALYHTRYTRPLKDYLVGSLEYLLPVIAHAPRVYNGLMKAKPVRWALSNGVGFEDAPLLPQIPLPKVLQKWRLEMATPATLEKLSDADKSRAVVLVQDAFTSFYEPQLVADIMIFLKQLGFKPLLAPFRANGKPLHVHGFLHAFTRVARKHSIMLQELAQYGVPLIGLDPAMTITLRSEYRKVLAEPEWPRVLLVQEWLATQKDQLRTGKSLFKESHIFRLMPHCTESTNAPAAIKDWQTVFTGLGQTLEIVAVGCCGMSGTYGHESRHRTNSTDLFNMSWRGPIRAIENQGTIATTGYSCRSQVKREAFVRIPHPLQLLLARMNPG